MNKSLIAVAMACAALSSGVANAQPQSRDEGHRQGGGAKGGGQPHTGGAGHEARGAATGHGQAGQAVVHGPTDRGGPATDRTTDHRETTNAGQSHFAGQASQNGRASRGTEGAGRASGRAGGQFVYHGQSHPVIRSSAFSYPQGWSYRRWSLGQTLPSLFLTAPYFFNDYSNYGFGPPPRGYRWVRYGPDLLLVNRRTGRIADVIYGAFY